MSVKEPLNVFCDENSLRFYLIDCGSGLMHLIILPDETVMLFDCNVSNDDEERILDFLEKHIPSKYDNDTGKSEKYIDIFVNSHRDEDHYRGLKKINNQHRIKSIWDSGQSGETTTSDDYNYYMNLRRELKKKSSDKLLVPTPTDSILKSFGDADIYCLAAEANFVESMENSAVLEYATKIQHTNSMVLLVAYGERKLLLTGDSDWKSWKEQIVPNYMDKTINYENTDILIASIDIMINISKLLDSVLASSCLYIFVYISDSLFSSDIKHKIITLFGAIKMPGNIIFAEIMNKCKDERFTKEEALVFYKDIYDNLPKEKKQSYHYQNSKWYKIYSKYRDVSVIYISNRDFLLCRDMVFATIVISFLYAISVGMKLFEFNLTYLCFLCMMFIVNICATHLKAKRFAYNVLAYDILHR